MRYSNDRAIRGGLQKATASGARRLRNAFLAGRISTISVVLGQEQRLDILAYKYLGNPSLWWTIATLSNIGWAMQLPPGTRLVIPTTRSQIEDLF